MGLGIDVLGLHELEGVLLHHRNRALEANGTIIYVRTKNMSPAEG